MYKTTAIYYTSQRQCDTSKTAKIEKGDNTLAAQRHLGEVLLSNITVF